MNFERIRKCLLSRDFLQSFDDSETAARNLQAHDDLDQIEAKLATAERKVSDAEWIRDQMNRGVKVYEDRGTWTVRFRDVGMTVKRVGYWPTIRAAREAVE